MPEAPADPAAQPEPHDASVADQVDDYRRLREELERAVLPLSTSLDGRRFTFQASLHHLDLRVGGYVVLEGEEHASFGQVLTMRPEAISTGDLRFGTAASSVRVRGAAGEGIVLDRTDTPFHDAHVRPATPGEVEDWFSRMRPPRSVLPIGDLLLSEGVGAVLDAGGFNRHTFMCGQSGSGKTYSLGLLLEQLLVRTSLRIVILDPNSDYVKLAHVRDDTDSGVAADYAPAAAGVAVWGNDDAAARPLRLQLADVDAAARAAVLGIDPIADREEHAALSALLAAGQDDRPLITSLDGLLSSGDPDVRRLGMRAANLGVLDWSIWSGGQGRSLVDELQAPTVRCLVVDLGSLDSMEEQRLISETVLSTLWRHRSRREPCLVVIDEAHNVCPSRPMDPITALATDYAARIAAEGRKFGLYLLTSTQRPQKVNEEVLSQCDNLLLMRMNSEGDLRHLRDIFSFVPSGLIEKATTFGLGEALVAGTFFPHPTFVKFGSRTSREGGADIPTAWAASS